MSLISYLSGVQNEVKEIKWPTRQQTIIYTAIVVVLSAVTSLYLAGLDFSFSKLIEQLVEIASK